MPILGERFPQRSHCLEYTVNGVSGPSVCYIYFIFFFFTGWQVSSNVMGLYISYIRYMKTCFMCACMKSLQLCLTLCDPVDHSPPDCSVHGILQKKILEWVAMPSSRGSSQPRGSNLGLPHCRRILYHLSYQGSPRILEWVAYLFSRGSSRLRDQTGVSCVAGRFFTNWALSEAWKWKSLFAIQARILEWVAFPSPGASSQPRGRTQVSHVAGGFLTSWATREALKDLSIH